MNFSYKIAVLLIIFSISTPIASAADLQVSGWIPYWATNSGIDSATKNLKKLSAVYPFVYSVASNGIIKDLGNISSSQWKSFQKKAQKEKVKFIPTIMSSDGTLVHELLSNSAKRKKHVSNIASVVKKGRFDGIDIDYEAKRADTKDSFSLFLKDLNKALKTKDLTCTIEARTPPESLYRVVPATLTYANDYKEMAKYCDQIEIMAYDQQRADILVNDMRKGAPYMPNADPVWVEKVIQLALRDIPKEKLVLGIPTYGTEYEVTVSPDWFRSYRRIRAINPSAGISLAQTQNIIPDTNSAGETGFAYMTPSSAPEIINFESGGMIPPSYNIAGQALAYANATGKTTTFNIVSWSNAYAIKQKVDLAKKYNLKGISLFKIDGEEDQELWKLFE